MSRITIEPNLYARAERVAAAEGYSSVAEFVAHAIENELKRAEVDQAEQQVSDQLRGLGYIE